jgi:hypothetical protein
MSAVLLAVFNDYDTADRMRVMLVRDGFPTDRVHLTASCELGCAGIEPANSPHAKCVQYFRTLLRREDEKQLPELLAHRIDSGAATITVLPRGAVETERATELLKQAHPADMMEHDCAKHGWEHAASRRGGGAYWVQHIWLEHSPDTDCIYCRLFPGTSH